MKSICTILGFFILLNAQSFAQQVRVGAEYSPGFSYFYSNIKNTWVEDQPKYNFSFGGKVQVEIKSSRFFVESGFQYQQRGTKQTATFNVPKMNLDIDFVFWSVPLLFRWEFKKWFLAGGPLFEWSTGIKYHDIKNSNRYTADPLKINKFYSDHLGLELNLGRTISLGEKISVNPHICYNMGRFYSLPRPGLSNQVGFLYSVELGVNVLYGFSLKKKQKDQIQQPNF